MVDQLIRRVGRHHEHVSRAGHGGIPIDFNLQCFCFASKDMKDLTTIHRVFHVFSRTGHQFHHPGFDLAIHKSRRCTSVLGVFGTVGGRRRKFLVLQCFTLPESIAKEHCQREIKNKTSEYFFTFSFFSPIIFNKTTTTYIVMQRDHDFFTIVQFTFHHRFFHIWCRGQDFFHQFVVAVLLTVIVLFTELFINFATINRLF